MIELRWLIRMVDRPKGIDDGFYQPPLPAKMETRVLQYRQREVINDVVQIMDDNEGWQDVPTALYAADRSEK